MSKLLLHIGYPKTGTTWLQRRIFPQLPGVNFIGRSYRQQNLLQKALQYAKQLRPAEMSGRGGTPWDYWMDLISYAPDALYDHTKTLDQLRTRIEDDRLNVISNENLVRPFSLEKTAERLHRLSEDAGLDPWIVLSIRNQNDLIWSRYCHDAVLQGTRQPYRLSEAITYGNQQPCYSPACKHGLYTCPCAARGVTAINRSFYDFNHSAELYAGIFGTERVHLLVGEQLFAQPLDALSALFEFCAWQPGPELKARATAAPENKGDPDTQTELELFNAEDLPMIQREIKAYFDASNRALNQRTPLDLAAFGYYHNPGSEP